MTDIIVVNMLHPAWQFFLIPWGIETIQTLALSPLACFPSFVWIRNMGQFHYEELHSQPNNRVDPKYHEGEGGGWLLLSSFSVPQLTSEGHHFGWLVSYCSPFHKPLVCCVELWFCLEIAHNQCPMIVDWHFVIGLANLWCLCSLIAPVSDRWGVAPRGMYQIIQVTESTEFHCDSFLIIGYRVPNDTHDIGVSVQYSEEQN